MAEVEIHESLKPTLHTFLKRVGLALLGLMVLIGLVGAYMYKDQLLLPAWLNSDTEEVVVKEDTIPGEIFFTLTESTTTNPVTYTANLEEQLQVLAESNLSGATQLSFSSNGEWVTFIAENRNLSEDEEVDDSVISQIFRANLADSTLEEAIANAEQVTDIQAARKSIPSINNKGEILFVSRGVGTNSAESEVSPIPGDWTVHYVRTDNIQSIIANGLYPQWYDDDDFFYLADDGIIRHSLNNSEENRLISLFFTPSEIETDSEEPNGAKQEGVLPHYIDTIFDISNDGSFLITSTSIAGNIGVFSITENEDEISLELVTSVDGTHAFWPQISPDNEHVGLLGFDPLRYGVYKLDTLEPVLDIDLAGFDSEDIFITDWR